MNDKLDNWLKLGLEIKKDLENTEFNTNDLIKVMYDIDCFYRWKELKGDKKKWN